MDARRESEPTAMKNRTTVERKSDRELVVTGQVHPADGLVVDDHRGHGTLLLLRTKHFEPARGGALGGGSAEA